MMAGSSFGNLALRRLLMKAARRRSIPGNAVVPQQDTVLVHNKLPSLGVPPSEPHRYLEVFVFRIRNKKWGSPLSRSRPRMRDGKIRGTEQLETCGAFVLHTTLERSDQVRGFHSRVRLDIPCVGLGRRRHRICGVEVFGSENCVSPSRRYKHAKLHTSSMMCSIENRGILVRSTGQSLLLTHEK